MKRWIYTAGLAGILAMSSASASAAVMEFTMGDHPDGVLWDVTAPDVPKGPYGLRLDNWFNTLFSVGDNILLTSAADVKLYFDPDDLGAGALILGKVQMTATDVVGSDVDDIWSLAYYMWDLSAWNGGFRAQNGFGGLTDNTSGDVDGGFDLITFIGKSDGNSVFEFAPDGHRLAGHAGYGSDDWVARGWVQTYYYDHECKCKKPGRTSGTNDFLMTAKREGDIPEVPEPSTMLLTMGGVALLWFRRRRG